MISRRLIGRMALTIAGQRIVVTIHGARADGRSRPALCAGSAGSSREVVALGGLLWGEMLRPSGAHAVQD